MEHQARYLADQVVRDLARKMVFLGGPRQSGKTTFSTHLRPKSQHTYLNWDTSQDRSRILDQELGSAPLLILDEIHKYKRWRNYLKGIWDSIKAEKAPAREILVTGSARLDLYRFGGDSLQGRYHYLRLLPFSARELERKPDAKLIHSLMSLGPFPEPFLRGSEVEAKRWSRDYRARLVREDVRDLERIGDLASLELLFGRLPECVGSPLSINALREDLQVAHATAAKWIEVIEKLYGAFRVPPFRAAKIKSVKKEQKLYLMDWTLVRDPGARFENMIAFHLLKWAYYLEDTRGENVELRYYRDRNNREVDFVLVIDSKATLLVECKLSTREISPSLRYLKQLHTGAQAYQVYLAESQASPDYVTKEGIRVCPAHRLLEQLV